MLTPTAKTRNQGTCVLNAEERFLPHLREINRKFPKLRIVLEHCTTAAAVEAVSFPLCLLPSPRHSPPACLFADSNRTPSHRSSPCLRTSSRPLRRTTSR